MLYIFLLILIVILGTFAYGGISGAPYVPMRKNDVSSFLDLADIKSGDKFIDIGCGDGRLLFTVARSGAIATGYEISLIPYAISKLKLLFLKEKNNVTIHYANFWNKNLRDADIIYFFLTPKFYPKIAKKLKEELRPGTKVLSYIWPIAGWEIASQVKTFNKNNLYLYIIK